MHWSVFGLSVGAISLLLVLIKRGAVAGVASIQPGAARGRGDGLRAVGETLSVVQIAGMGVAVVAVGYALASRA